MRWFLLGLRRLVILLVAFSLVAAGIAWLTHAKHGGWYHGLAVGYYITGALAVLSALSIRGAAAGARWRFDDTADALRASNAGRAANLLVGLLLLALGAIFDSLS